MRRANKQGDKSRARRIDAMRGSSPRRFVRRVLKWSLVALVLVTLAPIGLLALYRLDFVHPVSTLMVRDWLSGRTVEREWVPLTEVSNNLVFAVAMSEDARYCAHDGVDWDQLSGVVDDALDGKRTRGASTIAMQTVKNLFLWPDRSYVRKALEVPLGLAADFVLGKRRLMEIYLNIAEWGTLPDGSVYGVGAAARHHFGRSALQLTARQGALLAATLPNPKERRAGRPRPGLRALARSVERRARASGPYVRCLRS